MKPSFFLFTALSLFFSTMGAMFSPSSALSNGNPGADADDDVALTEDSSKKKTGLFDDVPGIAGGCRGEFTCSSVFPSGVEAGADDDRDYGVIVAGTMTFVDSVRFDQPTFIHVEEDLVLQSSTMLNTTNLHIMVHSGGRLIVRAPAMRISRDDEISDWPLLTVSGTMIFEPSGSIQPLLDGSLKDEGDVVMIPDGAAVFLSDQDIVRYPNHNSITVSRMTDEDAGDDVASPHLDKVEQRPEMKAFLASIHAMLNGESRVLSSPSSFSYSPSSTLSPSLFFLPPSPDVVDKESESIISSLALYSIRPGRSAGSLHPAVSSPSDTAGAITAAIAPSDKDGQRQEHDTSATTVNTSVNDPSITGIMLTWNGTSTATSPRSLTGADFNGSSIACSLNPSPDTEPCAATLTGDDSSIRMSRDNDTTDKNTNMNHGHIEDEQDGEFGGSTDMAEPHHASLTGPLSPPTTADEGFDGSTVHSDDDHHHDHSDGINRSGKDDPEQIGPTPTKNSPSPPTTTNVPVDGFTQVEASGKGTKTQGSPARRSTSVDKFFFDLTMAWVAIEMNREHGEADHSGGSYINRGIDTTKARSARTRSVSGRRSINNDDYSSALRHPDHFATVKNELKEPLVLPSSSGRPDAVHVKDGLTIILEKNPKTTITADSSTSASSSSSSSFISSFSSEDTEVVKREQRVRPATTAAATEPAVEVPAIDADRGNRLVRARKMLGDMRQKAGLSAVTPETEQRGVGGWASWRTRRHHQGGTTARGQRRETEVARDGCGRVDATVDETNVESELDLHPREQSAIKSSPWVQSKASQGTGDPVEDDGMRAKSGKRTFWGITAADLMD